MADTTFHIPAPTTGRMSRFFEGWMNTLARTDRIDALQAKSDADLARMGLRRDDIVRHVYRDRSAF